MYIATLRCGMVLGFEARGFVPAVGDVFPCVRHGYCLVECAGRRESSAVPRALPRSPRRTEPELLDWLRECPVTTVHALRVHRFTLRMIAAAARKGHVTVDFVTGRVTLRLLPAAEGDAVESRPSA